MASHPLSEIEIKKTREAVERTLNQDGSQNITAAARLLGISRSALRGRIQVHGIEPIKRFTLPEVPSSLPTIDELLERRTRQGDRSIAADDARSRISIKLHMDGPIAIWCWGDPHIDADGCNLRLLREHVELAKNEAIYSLHIGDISNNWTGRLAHLWADQSTSAKEAWMLVEWLLSQHEHLAVVLGNHDCWSGSGNPIDWILRHQGALVEPHGVRIALNHPCGAVTRVNARHDFRGRSQYSNLHGLRRELAFGATRDHLLLAGHLHSGEDAAVVTGEGMVSQLVRVSGYKQVDHFADQLGFPPKKIHPSALCIIDPREPETSRARVWVAPTVEIGVKILKMMREDYARSSDKQGVRAGQGNHNRKRS